MKTGMVSGGAIDSRNGHGGRTRKRGRSYFGYIVERGSSLHFRISVPKQLRQVMGKAEIRLSLGAIAYTVARPRAYLLASRTRMLFEFITERMKEGVELDKARLNTTMHKMLNWELGYREPMIAEIYFGKSAEYIAKDLREYSKEYSNRIYTSNEIDGTSVFDSWYCSVEDKKRKDKDLKKHVVNLVNAELGCGEELAGEVFDTFKEEICTSESKFDAGVFTARGFFDRVSSVALRHSANKIHDKFDIQEAHSELNRYFPQPAEATGSLVGSMSQIVGSVPQIINNTLSAITLGEAVDRYIKKLDVTLGKDGNKNGAKNKYHGLKELALIIGRDTMVSHITIDMMEEYADKLKHIPARFDIENMRHDINEFGVTRHAKKKLSPKTISKRLTDTSTLIEWMKGNRYIDKDHAKSLRSIVSGGVRECKERVKREGGSPTRPYSMDELSKIFDAETYLKWTRRRADYFWPPIIAVYTGMRMGEIMTLRRKDIKCTPDMMDYYVESKKKSRHTEQESGIYYIDLTSIVEKRLKDNGGASHRPIPIHPFLIEIGFLDYVARFSPEDFIFRGGLMLNSKRNGEYSTQFQSKYKLTDRFREYRISLDIGRMNGESDGDMLTFHCFRNTAIAKMRDSDVNPELRCEISGHRKVPRCFKWVGALNP